MDRLHLRKRLIGWIACFAMLLNALAPSVSHAVAAAYGVPPWLADICTADGGLPAPVTQPGGVPQPLHLDHCPYCAVHAGSFALPSDAGAVVPTVGAAAPPPPLQEAPRRMCGWSARLPRAPPSLP